MRRLQDFLLRRLGVFYNSFSSIVLSPFSNALHHANHVIDSRDHIFLGELVPVYCLFWRPKAYEREDESLWIQNMRNRNGWREWQVLSSHYRFWRPCAPKKIDAWQRHRNGFLLVQHWANDHFQERAKGCLTRFLRIRRTTYSSFLFWRIKRNIS